MDFILRTRFGKPAADPTLNPVVVVQHDNLNGTFTLKFRTICADSARDLGADFKCDCTLTNHSTTSCSQNMGKDFEVLIALIFCR